MKINVYSEYEMMRRFNKTILCVLTTAALLCVGACNDEKKDSASSENLGSVELGQYLGVEVELENTNVTEEEINTTIKSYLKSLKYKDESDTKVDDGDVVNIDYVGKIDGKEFPGGTDSNSELEIGSGKFISGFESSLVGLNVGDKKTINVTFPKNYDPSFAGKDATFDVTINYIYKVPSELTDKLVAEDKSNEYKTVKEYRDYVKSDIIKNKESNNETKLGQELVSKIMDKSKFSDLNEDVIREKYQQQRKEIESKASMSNVSLEDYVKNNFHYSDLETFDKDLIVIAEDSVKQEIVYDAIAKKENITVTDDEYEEQIKKWIDESSQYQGKVTKEQIINAYGSEEKTKKAVVGIKVLEKIKKEAKIKYVDPKQDDAKQDDAKQDTKKD